MLARHPSIRLLLAGLFTLVLSNCSIQNVQTASAPSINCNQANVSVNCILQTAQQHLVEIDDDFSWSTSAVELSLAKDAIGDTEAAWQLLATSIQRAETIKDQKIKANALLEIASSLSYMQKNTRFPELHSRLSLLVPKLENADKRVDITGKLYTARAAHGDYIAAYKDALKLVAENATQDSYKLRTVREISAKMAKRDDFDAAIQALSNLEGDFTYYQGTARTDISTVAIKAGRQDLTPKLLADAVKVGRSQKNKYFAAGILRDVGYNYLKLGNSEQASLFIDEARSSARIADKPNGRARSMSRIATKLADAGHLDLSEDIINESIELARKVESPTMLNYSLYEIAGAAAFSNQLASAKSLLTEIPDDPFGSATSLRSAVQRDLAWGLARYGKTAEAIQTAEAITSPRERIQALSRIIRLLKEPDMKALPRYL